MRDPKNLWKGEMVACEGRSTGEKGERKKTDEKTFMENLKLGTRIG